MKFKRVLGAIAIVSLILYFLNTNATFLKITGEEVINYPSINSISFLYPFKRVWEKAHYYIIVTKNNRFLFNKSLIGERLSELRYVVEKKISPEIKPTTERFAYQAGITVDQLISLNEKNIPDKIDKTNHLKANFENYKKTLASLRDLYEANSSYWLLIQQDIDTLDILFDKIKN